MAQHVLSDKEFKLLQQLLNKTRSMSPYGEIPPDEPPVLNGAPEVYVACLPADGIRKRVGLNPGSAECAIFKVEGYESEDYELVRVDPLCKTVLNIGLTDVVRKYVLVVRDKWGAWFVTHETGISEEASDATSTTSPPGPTAAECDGEAEWEWDAGTRTWTLTNDGCSEPSTSSTSSTPAPATSTSTTPNPCDCISQTSSSSTSSTSSTSSSSTSSTTSTTPGPCSPSPPQFCGEDDGECTFTYCAKRPPAVFDCSDTTSTSTTTPAPGDCTTTTPTPCADLGFTGCVYGYVIDEISGRAVVRLIENGCAGYDDPCGNPQCEGCGSRIGSCTCCEDDTVVPPAPGDTYSPWGYCGNSGSPYCGNNFCACAEDDCEGVTETVPCNRNVREPEPVREPFKCGSACWAWAPGHSKWVDPNYDGFNSAIPTVASPTLCPDCDHWACDGSATYREPTEAEMCVCKPPSTPGNGWCDMRIVACEGGCQACEEGEIDPCNPRTSTTTTTPNPCGTGCRYEGDGDEGWTLQTNNCEPECQCRAPTRKSRAACDRNNTDCVPGTSTTSPPTTSTTSTTGNPWFCDAGVSEDCDEATCVQLPADEVLFPCGGPFATQQLCVDSPCGTNPPTTTTSTSTSTSSSSSSSSTSSSTSTTCSPSTSCSGNSCTIFCDLGDTNVWTMTSCNTPNDCVCDPTDAEFSIVNQPCASFDTYLIPCCNDCPDATQPCGERQTTTPAP